MLYLHQDICNLPDVCCPEMTIAINPWHDFHVSDQPYNICVYLFASSTGFSMWTPNIPHGAQTVSYHLSVIPLSLMLSR